MRRKKINIVVSIFVVIFSWLTLPANASDAWKFSIEPYMMITSIDGHAGVGRVTGATVAVDFDDILENLDVAGMIHLEAHHESGWGALIDYGFMNLGADISGPLGGIVDTDVHQGILELFVVRRIDLAHSSIELYGGLRWWDNDIDIKIDPQVLPGSLKASVKEDWFDPVVGVRFKLPVSEKWTVVLRGDVGGFGAGSDFTALTAAGLVYNFYESVSLDMQYKALWVDYEAGAKGTPGYFAYDTTTHGPVVGIIFGF